MKKKLIALLCAIFLMGIIGFGQSAPFRAKWIKGTFTHVMSFKAGISILENTELRFYDNGNYVGFEAPALAADQIWVLPSADGSNLEVLRTDGSGTLSWAAAAAGAGVVELDDTDADQVLIFDWSEDGAADYTLDWKVNAASRTMTIFGDFTLSGTNTVANWSVTAELDITGAGAIIDLNPSGTGTKNIIDITPSAELVAGAVWHGVHVDTNTLDPATGAAATIHGFHFDAPTLASTDGDTAIIGFYATHPAADSSSGFSNTLKELTASKTQNAFRAFGGTPALTATGTYNGLFVDWDGVTRDGGSPVLHGVNVLLPASYASYGTSYAGFFSGDGRTVTLCDTTYALDIVGPFRAGVDGTGHDITFYSATANDYWLWDESDDAVVHHMTMGETTASETAHKITVVDATTASAGMHRGLVVDYTSSGAKTGSSYVAGINVDMTISDASSGAAISAYGLATYITESGTPAIDIAVGIESYIEDLGGGTLGHIVGMDSGINSTNLATGRHTALRVKSHVGTGKSAILFEGNWTIGLDFTGNTSGGAASTIATDIMMTSGGLLNANTGLIDNAKGYCYDAETTATPSAAFTVDWTTRHVQRVTITGVALDVTFTDPPGPCRLILIVVQGDGSDTIDWTNEASILFPGAVDPTLSTGSGDIDIVVFYFDGTSYLGLFNGDFS